MRMTCLTDLREFYLAHALPGRSVVKSKITSRHTLWLSENPGIKLVGRTDLLSSDDDGENEQR